MMNHPESKPVSQKETTPLKPLSLYSRDIFQGKKYVIIHHNEQEYRLMVTRQGKLILTK